MRSLTHNPPMGNPEVQMPTFTINMPDDELERLRVLYAVQIVSARRGRGHYWFDQWGIDRAMVRWIEGGCEETVALLEFPGRTVLFLEDMADFHSLLLEMFDEHMGWTVHLVDGLIAPTCPECGGAGGFHHCLDAFHTTFRGFKDCELCGGTGVLS